MFLGEVVQMFLERGCPLDFGKKVLTQDARSYLGCPRFLRSMGSRMLARRNVIGHATGTLTADSFSSLGFESLVLGRQKPQPPPARMVVLIV